VETVILASALETIDRVGPCKAKIVVDSIEDVRVSKRQKIIERARDLLTDLIKQSKTSGIDLTESVRQSVQVEEVIYYGKERLPAGPNVPDSDAIIVVEGRSDVLNLLKSGIKNAIAVEGTNIPKTISELSKERVITAFVDGDRGGELILRELFQVAEVDFVARAPKGHEVEELTQKQIMKCLRNKIPAEQFIEMFGLEGDQLLATRNGEKAGIKHADTNEKAERAEKAERSERFERQERAEKEQQEKPQRQEKPERQERQERAEKVEAATVEAEEKRPAKKLNAAQEKYKGMINELSTTSKARIIGANGAVLKEIAVKELVNNLKEGVEGVTAVVFDGIVTQRILDIAAEQKIGTIVGTKLGNITKQPANVEIWTKEDLN
jgi:DNA primase